LADFRLCVYDNASGDDTMAVVEEFRRRDKRVEYFRRSKNVGGFANFMDGANRVETPYFSFLPDDDVMLPHFFETSLEGFRRHPEAAMSILTTIRMSANGFALDAPILQWPDGLLLPPVGMLSILRYGNPDLPGLLIRRAVWEELRGFDEAIGPCCDVDFELRASARYPVVVSKEPGGILLVHDNTVTARSYLDWVWPALPRMADKLAQNVDIPQAARQEAAELLGGLLRRGLIMRGVVRSIIGGKWDEAERAADLFLQECKWTRVGGVIRPARMIGQKVPGMRALLRALLAARASLRVLQHFNLQWRFRSYSKLVRVSP
jgi:hypothetical protein